MVTCPNRNNTAALSHKKMFNSPDVAATPIHHPPPCLLERAFTQVPDWEPLFDLDVGVPLGECTESPTGVFSRKYTNGVVSLSCPVGDGNWTASLPFHY